MAHLGEKIALGRTPGLGLLQLRLHDGAAHPATGGQKNHGHHQNQDYTDNRHKRHGIGVNHIHGGHGVGPGHQAAAEHAVHVLGRQIPNRLV